MGNKITGEPASKRISFNKVQVRRGAFPGARAPYLLSHELQGILRLRCLNRGKPPRRKPVLIALALEEGQDDVTHVSGRPRDVRGLVFCGNVCGKDLIRLVGGISVVLLYDSDRSLPATCVATDGTVAER